MSLLSLFQHSQKLTLSGLFTISLILVSNSQPALAEVVFSVRQILSITPISETGSAAVNGIPPSTGVTLPDNTSAWLQRAARRVSGAAWQFNDDGTFTFYLPNTRTDLYPIKGRYKRQGNRLFFEGSRTANTQVSKAKSFHSGTIDLSKNPPVMDMQWGSSQITGVVVNQASHGSNKMAAYRAVLQLQRTK